MVIVAQVRQEIDGGRVGPVDVVEQHDERAFPGEDFDEALDGTGMDILIDDGSGGAAQQDTEITIDADEDGWPFPVEVANGTAPGDADSDDDGLPDRLEPNDMDTDDDGNMDYNDADDDGDGTPGTGEGPLPPGPEP